MEKGDYNTEHNYQWKLKEIYIYMNNDHSCVGNEIISDNFFHNLNFMRHYYFIIITEVGENIIWTTVVYGNKAINPEVVP